LVVASLALMVLVVAGCEREKWKPDTLAYDSIALDEAELGHGRETYKTYCVGCHGEAGDGQGPAARFLNPRPRDFRSGIIKFAAVEAGQLPYDQDLVRVIRAGLHGTSMPAWRFLPERSVNSVVGYVKSFAAEAYAADEPHARIVPDVDPWVDSNEQDAIEEGAAVFHALALCNNCHPSYLTKQEIYDLSKEKYGYGVTSFRENMYEGVVTETDWGDELRAPDFLTTTLKNGTAPADLYRVIVSGVGGTAMPTWRGALPEEQLWALVHFVKSIADKRGTPEAAALQRKLANQPPFVPPAAPTDDEEEES
jgi:mono/diheme cytochrome c family protein